MTPTTTRPGSSRSVETHRDGSASSCASDDIIRATNDVAFRSSISAMEKGYFHDPYLACMKKAYEKELAEDMAATPMYTMPPATNLSTFARVSVKRNLLKSFLLHTSDRIVQVLSLGAGYDSYAFALFENVDLYPPFRYVEVDFEEVTRTKIGLADSVLRDAVLFDDTQFSKDTSFCGSKRRKSRTSHSYYSIQPCDLRDVSILRRVLADAGMEPEKPTLILAEVVLVYMKPLDSDGLIRFLSQAFTGPRCFLNVEHVKANDHFGEHMEAIFAQLNLSLPGLQKYPTFESQRSRFLDCGWNSVRTESLLSLFENCTAHGAREALDAIEAVDDMERWRLILKHYIVLIAGAGDFDLDVFRIMNCNAIE